jgi:hypothetical protein
MLFYVKFPEDDLKNFETYRSTKGLYVKVYILILGYLLVLCMCSSMHGYEHCPRLVYYVNNFNNLISS